MHQIFKNKQKLGGVDILESHTISIDPTFALNAGVNASPVHDSVEICHSNKPVTLGIWVSSQ